MITHTHRPSRQHLAQVARRLKARLNRRAFVTVPRWEITDMLREESTLETTRLKSQLARDLEQVLLENGVRCFPAIADTDRQDNVRLFHAGTVLSGMVNLLLHPSPQNDRELGDTIKKVKGQWTWSTPSVSTVDDTGTWESPVEA